MTKRRVILVAVACLMAAVVVALVFWPGEKEPEYQGKKLSEWLSGFELEVQPGKPTRDEAVEAVRRIGTNVIPQLLGMMSARETDLQQRIARLARRQRVIRIRYVQADSRRWVARDAFLALGRDAKYAAAQLKEIDREDVNRSERTRYAAEILAMLMERGEDVGWASTTIRLWQITPPVLATNAAVGER